VQLTGSSSFIPRDSSVGFEEAPQSFNMLPKTVISVLVACAIGQAYAAPHFLLTVKRVAAPVVEDIKGQHAPLEKVRFSLRDAFLSDRGEALKLLTGLQLLTPDLAAVPVLTMDQLESERDSIRKRDMSSTVAANINTLITKKTVAGTPGYEAFATAIMAAGEKVKRGVDLVTRYVECITYTCVKAQQPEPKDVSLSEHIEAIKPREVRSHQEISLELLRSQWMYH
jgi:hypothetical protein